MARFTTSDIPFSLNKPLKSSNRVDVADNAALKPAQITVAAWIKFTSPSNPPFQPFVIKSTSGFWTDGYGIITDNIGVLRFWVNAWNVGVAVTPFGTYVGKWIRVVGTYDLQNVKLYVNGALVDTSASYTTAITHSSGALRFMNGPSTDYALGSIADVSISNAAWSATDVANDYYKQIQPSSVTNRWKINEGNGTTVSDSVGGLSGTITGLAWSKDTPCTNIQNQIQWSEDFAQSVYSKINVTPTTTTDTLDPFGGNDATKFTESLDASPLTHEARQITTWTTGKVVTFSAFVKAGSRTWAAIYSRGGGVGTYVNLSTGATGTKGGSTYIGAGAVDYGNGWIRGYVSFIDDGGGHSIYMANADGGATYQGDGSSYMYVFGAQVDLGAEMLPYRPTNAYSVNTNPRTQIADKQNLLTHSQTLTSWSNVDTPTITGGQIAPDGTATAFAIQDSSAAAYQGKTQTITVPADKALYTFSFRIKKQDAATAVCGVNLVFSGGTIVGYSPRINPQTGADAGGYTINKKDLGEYWEYEISVQNNGTNTSFNITLYPATGVLPLGSGDSVTATATVVFWQPQLVRANWGGPIRVTGSTPFNESGIRSVATGRSTVPTQQNLLLRSQELDSDLIAWNTFSNGSISANAGVAPDGTTTAERLVPNNSVTSHILSNVSNSHLNLGTGMYTLSIYGKADGINVVRLQMTASGSNPIAYFNFSTGQVGSVTPNVPTSDAIEILGARITPAGNGYYRAEFSILSKLTGPTQLLYTLASDAEAISFAGDDSKGIYLWGAQLVKANWAGTYTLTTSAAVNTGSNRKINCF